MTLLCNETRHLVSSLAIRRIGAVSSRAGVARDAMGLFFNDLPSQPLMMSEEPEEPAPGLSGVRCPSGVETCVHDHDASGSAVQPLRRLPGGACRWAAPPLGFALADLADPALAAPAVRREVVVPPRIVHRQHRARPGFVLFSRLSARSEFVEEEGEGPLGALGALPNARGAGGADVGPVDGAEKVGVAQLDSDPPARSRIDHFLLSPPAFPLEKWSEVLLEL